MGLFSRWRRASIERPQRWVVVDVETSGMDSARDTLISIGAVAIVDHKLRPADSIELVVRQSAASAHANILVHGIGVQAQLSGVDPRQAMRSFVEYVQADPLLAFHAPFDRGFLTRAVKAWAEVPLDNPWLDLAELAPALEPRARLRSLDEWLQHYGIVVATRHSAAADAFATALLALRLLPLARAQGVRGLSGLQKLARNARWIN